MKIKKIILKNIFVQHLLAFITSIYIYFVRFTSKIVLENSSSPNYFWKNNKPFILAFWHSQLMTISFAWSKKTKINEDLIINSHLSTQFFVYMIGFMPGLPFMGDLETNLNVPRLMTPRLQVPPGSVGIVDKFCVIYPNKSPGGWNIIGRTPIKLFDKNKIKATLLNPGSKVKICKISKKEFLEIQKINE